MKEATVGCQARCRSKASGAYPVPWGPLNLERQPVAFAQEQVVRATCERDQLSPFLHIVTSGALHEVGAKPRMS